MTDESYHSLTRRQMLGSVLVGASGVVLASCGGGGSSTHASTTAKVAPRRGGTFRFGPPDSSSSDSIDAKDGFNTTTNWALCGALYNTLVVFDHATNQPVLSLADEFTPSADVMSYTIRLKPNIRFHNGQPLTADDVIFTLKRILNPKSPGSAASQLTAIDTKRLQKLDPLTVRIHLNFPDVTIPWGVANAGGSIVPVGYDPAHPVGTGPFTLQSFNPGVRTTFARNNDYWQEGLPYLDSLEVIGFADPGTARINSLVSGQIDGASRLEPSLLPTVRGASGVKVLVSDTRIFNTWEMRVDVAPFSDVRVRQALKLVANRQQIVEQALGGSDLAVVGNDIPGSPQDPMYDHSIAQREQDIEQAKSLLKAAGQENMVVTLNVSPITGGVVETAQVYSQQAKLAGVTININNIADSATYFSKYYVQAPFKFDYWDNQPILTVGSLSLMPGAGYNLTNWADPTWVRLFSAARGELDVTKRKEILAEAQTHLWNTGPQAIFGYSRTPDAYSTKFTGFVPDLSGNGLMGMYFDTIYLA